MKPLSTTQQEQDKLFDELCIGCGFGAANIQGLKEFMRNRDLAIENAVRAEAVEKAQKLRHSIIKADKTPRYSYTSKNRNALNSDGELPNGGRWKNCSELMDDFIALLTTSPSR